MGFDIHRDAGLVRQPPPAFEQRNALFDPVRPHIGLQIDMVGAEPRHQFQHRLQVVDIGRIALRLPDHVVAAQERGDFAGEMPDR